MELDLQDPAFFRGTCLRRPDMLHRVLDPTRLGAPSELIKQTLIEAMEEGSIAPCDPELTTHAFGASMYGLATALSHEQAEAMIETTIPLLDGLR